MHKIIERSESLIQWIDKQIDSLEVDLDERMRLSAGCLDIALEHQKAIVLLVANKLYGSAFALARPIFEAYVRGVWLQLCASKPEIEKYKKDKLEKNFSTLIKEIERCDGFEEGILSAAKTANWIPMNSFTHSGYLQTVRRNKEETIKPNYTDEEIIELLNIVNALGLLSTLQIALLADKKELANKMLEKSKIMFSNKP